jgi:hypothetical protein
MSRRPESWHYGLALLIRPQSEGFSGPCSVWRNCVTGGLLSWTASMSMGLTLVSLQIAVAANFTAEDATVVQYRGSSMFTYHGEFEAECVPNTAYLTVAVNM